MFDTQVFVKRAAEICEAGAFFFGRNWCPATSSNFSARVDAEHIAITVSGRHKGELRVEDIMCVDLDGRAVGSQHRPSAETLLHTHLYRRNADIGAVLHTHSVNATVLSRLYAEDGEIRLDDQEIWDSYYNRISKLLLKEITSKATVSS